MNAILNSEDFADFCENYNCDEDCPLFLYKSSNGTGYSCSSRFYKNKFEAEKAKAEKLKKALTLAVKSAEFFSGHADCRKEGVLFKCHCSFCKESDVKIKDLREARQTLKEIEV